MPAVAGYIGLLMRLMKVFRVQPCSFPRPWQPGWTAWQNRQQGPQQQQQQQQQQRQGDMLLLQQMQGQHNHVCKLLKQPAKVYMTLLQTCRSTIHVVDCNHCIESYWDGWLGTQPGTTAIFWGGDCYT
jgi:hypothetical protein